MLLHLGGDWAANSSRIVAILDYGAVSGSRSVKKMLQTAENRNLLERIDEESETRSVVLIETAKGTRLVLSPISSSALKGRLESGGIVTDFTPALVSGRKGR